MILGFKIGFLEIDYVDIIDILLFALLLQQVYKLMKGSVAIKIFLGFHQSRVVPRVFTLRVDQKS